MRAVATTPAGLAVVERPVPTPGPHEVLVKVERCGICGSDLHLHRAGVLPGGSILGHEFAGTVVQLGDEATGVAEGTRVAVLPAVRCGTCRACLEGRDAICLTQSAHALGLGTLDGAYAEYVKIAAKSCFPLPPGMTPEQGALVEPYAVAVHAVRRSRATSQSVVGVIGAGPIGLMTVAALRAIGVDDLVVAEPNPKRAALAEAMGAATVVADMSHLAGSVDREIDVVFECAGIGAAPGVALQTVRSGGQIMLVGIADPADTIALASYLWVMKEVDIAASLAYSSAEFEDALVAVGGGAIDDALLVSDIRPLDEAQRSFDDLTKPGGPVKILLAP